MPYEIFLALRHLRSRQKRRLANVTALIAVVGIAVGVGALIVALALANGFRDELQDKILRGTAHLTVMRSNGQPLADYEKLAARIADVDGVVSATGTTYDGAVVVGRKETGYAVLRGVDRNSVQASEEIKRVLIDGSAAPLFGAPGDSADLPSVVLGSELAARVGLRVGDAAELLVSPSEFQPPTGKGAKCASSVSFAQDCSSTTPPGSICRWTLPRLFPERDTGHL